MARDISSVADEVVAVLTERGVPARRPDVYGFVSAAWPTDDTPEELADGWEEAAAEVE